jgi:hypothetical protein
MAFTLGRHIHACIDGDVPIFLDLAWDRYFRLTTDAEAAFRRLARHESPSAGDDLILADLVERGVLETNTRDDQDQLLTPVLPLATEPACRAKPSARIFEQILIARCRMRFSRRHVRAKLLALVYPALHAAAPAADDTHTANGLKLAETMAASLMLSDLVLGQAEHCLERGLALVHLLRRAGERAELVFGVTSRPFAAHCWVQQGNLLLGDTVERVRTFTPIAVL